MNFNIEALVEGLTPHQIKVLNRVNKRQLCTTTYGKNFYRSRANLSLWDELKYDLQYVYEVIFKGKYRQIVLNDLFVIEKVFEDKTCLLAQKETKAETIFKIMAKPRLDESSKDNDYLLNNLCVGKYVRLEHEVYFHTPEDLFGKKPRFLEKLFLTRPTYSRVLADYSKNGEDGGFFFSCCADYEYGGGTDIVEMNGEICRMYKGYGYFIMSKSDNDSLGNA